MSNGSFNQKQIDNMKQIGATGGSVDTTGMNATDKAIADKSVNDGRKGNK